MADALFVAHADDETLFCWSLLQKAKLIVIVVDAGYTRSMEARIHLAAEAPNAHLYLHRVQEPLPDEASWDVTITDLHPLPETSVALARDALRWLMREHGCYSVAVPGDLDDYPHPHHRQLMQACYEADWMWPAGLEEERVDLGVEGGSVKATMLGVAYQSEGPGLHKGPIHHRLCLNEDRFRLFTARP